MSDVKRYSPSKINIGALKEDENGCAVSYEDYESLEQQLKESAEELDEAWERSKYLLRQNKIMRETLGKFEIEKLIKYVENGHKNKALDLLSQLSIFYACSTKVNEQESTEE